MLNPKTIESEVRNATSERLLVDDTGERGTGRLGLRIRPAPGGARAEWVSVWWRDGRRRIGVMGRYPDLSLRAARDLFAGEWRPEIEAGRDPRRARQVAAAAGTVGDLFAEYVASLRRAGRPSAREVEHALLTGKKNAAEALGRDDRAADVRPETVAAFLARVYQRGARTAADRYRSYMHAAFQWGARSTHDYTRSAGNDGPRTHYGIVSNPVGLIPRDHGANRARDRALSVAELRALWSGCEGEGFSLLTTPAIRLLICTGQRVTDILRARGEHFDLEAGTWEIPSELRKKDNGVHVVPLAPQAIEVLRELIDVRGKGILFPRKGKPHMPIPYQSINQALKRWAERAEVPPFQARDLRRTWKTLAGEAGISKEMRDRIQGHALTDVSAVHYDRYAYLREKREAMATWSAWLDGILRQTVVSIRQAA